MSRNVQIAIDCADPHRMNRFWAALMQFEVEHHDALIRQLMEVGHVTSDDTVEIDGELWFAGAAACRSGDGTRRLLFQTVPEPKTVKDRIHLDVHVGADEREAVVAWCLANGATKLWDGRQGPQTWVTLADPEGNEFCIS